MAAFESFQDKVSKLLECSICLDRLVDPKVLHCTHSFCKRCLDSILEFKKDGSAYVECPLRCPGVTEVDADKTTNDLKAPLQFKNLMDMIAEEVATLATSEKKYRCDGSASCLRNICAYCPSCSSMLCDACRKQHNHEMKVECIPIKQDTMNKDIVPWCELHATFATDVCDDGVFTCVYCKERTHKNHRTQSIESLSSQMKSWVNTQVMRSGEAENVILNTIKLTEDEITNIRDSLRTSLKFRKLICLTEYLNELNEEERRLINDFNTITTTHIRTYPSAKQFDFANMKTNFQVILQRERMYENLRMLKTFPILHVNLTDRNYRSLDPLGNVICEALGSLHLINDTPQASVSSRIPKVEDVDLHTVMKDLEILLKEVATTDHGLTCQAEELGCQKDTRRKAEEVFTPVKEGNNMEYAWHQELSRGTLLEENPSVFKNCLENGFGSATTDRDLTCHAEESGCQKDTRWKIEEVVTPEKAGNNKEYAWHQELSRGTLVQENPSVLKNFSENGFDYVLELVKKKKVEMFKLLWNVKKAEIMKLQGDHDIQMSSVFHWAAYYGACEIVEIMLNDGHPVDVTNLNNDTPLMWAACGNHSEMIHLLVKHDSDILKQDKGGLNSVDSAKVWNNHQSVTLLETYLDVKGLVDTGLYCNNTIVQAQFLDKVQRR